MLTKEELLNVYGGAISFGIVSAIVAGVVFVIGVIDGYLRPLKCR